MQLGLLRASKAQACTGPTLSLEVLNSSWILNQLRATNFWIPGDRTKCHNTSDGRNGGGVAHKAQMPFHTRVLEPSRLFGETHVVGYPGTAGSCILHEWMLDGFSEHLTDGFLIGFSISPPLFRGGPPEGGGACTTQGVDLRNFISFESFETINQSHLWS